MLAKRRSERTLDEIEAELRTLLPRHLSAGRTVSQGPPKSSKRLAVEEMLRSAVVGKDAPVEWDPLRRKIAEATQVDERYLNRIRRDMGIRMFPPKAHGYAYPPHIPIPKMPSRKLQVSKVVVAHAAKKGLAALEDALKIPDFAKIVREAEAKVARGEKVQTEEPPKRKKGARVSKKKTKKKSPKATDIPSFARRRKLIHTKDGVQIVDDEPEKVTKARAAKKVTKAKVKVSEADVSEVKKTEVKETEVKVSQAKEPAKVELPEGCLDFRLEALIGRAPLRRSTKDCLVGQGVRTVEDALRLGRWLVELVGEDQAERIVAYARGER